MAKLSSKLEKADTYYRKHQEKTAEVVKAHVRKKGHIVYGGHARNAVVPGHLKRHTEDWDIGVNLGSKDEAAVLRDTLNRETGNHNYFVLHKGKHEGTWRIFCKISKKVVADITRLEEDMETVSIGGIKYPTRTYQIKKVKESLKRPENAYRRNTDEADLVRLEIAEKLSKASKGGK